MSDVEVTEEGDFIFMGNVDFIQGASADILMFKTDSDGEIIWEQIYEFPRQDVLTDISFDNDNNLIAAGYSSSFDDFGNDYEVFVMKFNELGDSLWTKTFENGERSCRATSLITLTNGNYLMSGVDYNDIDNSSSQILFLKISNEGDFIDQKITGGEEI